MRHPLGLCFAAMLLASSACAEQLTRAERDLFENHARPLLVSHCIQCHGAKEQEGGLRLTSREHILSGGDSGPAMVPGKASESLIIEALQYDALEMPPAGKLDEKLIVGLSKWIDAGAPWPDDVTLTKRKTITADDRKWWCYQPVKDTDPPICPDDDWCRTEIDQFILHRLQRDNIHPSRQADQLTLARRVHFSITGLPPDAQTLQDARSPDFDYEKLVDRLLESKSYGENQARYWLDLVRYADSDGYRADHKRPEAYRYRDYVIGSFNDDKPYDRFIWEQLAGDEIDPGNKQALIATMYLRHWIYEHNQRDVETQWHEILSDITETTSDVFLAQGLKCARCHDHKFDPLLQKDYFRLKAFFAAFQPVEKQPIADIETLQQYQAAQEKWETATAELRQQIRDIEYPIVLKHATREGFEKFIPKIKAMIRKPASQRLPYEQQIGSLAERQFDLPYDKLDEWLSESEIAERKRLKIELAKHDKLKPKPLPTLKFVAADVGPIAPLTTIPDGDGSVVEPGFLTLLDEGDADVQPVAAALRSTGRRSALAKWITDPSNPFTARVIVNRVWQQHFGNGIVETASDFGHLGMPPSHPALLDWLATRFVQDDHWSIKKLHRRILLSATFRQTSRRPITDKITKIDPDNHLLWRMNPRRLSGEEINDAVLSASGELKQQKRAIYKRVRRNSPDAVLAAFDAPDRIRSIGKRHRTTTSPQALLLSNSAWAHERAQSIAKRHGRSTDQALVSDVYEDLFGRQPSHDEWLLAKAFLNQYAQNTPTEPTPNVQVTERMPTTGSHAALLKPGGPLAISIASTDSLPKSDFTVEAVILLRSLYKNASVRTIVAHWPGDKNRPGWAFGVTSEKSAYKPRNLILQLTGKTKAGNESFHYEVIPSNLRPELNKPYYVAASVDLDDVSKNGITFYLKDLSKKNAKLQIANVKHTVIAGIHSKQDLMLGDRSGTHQWDGLIDNFRLETKRRDLSNIAQADSPAGLPDLTIDWQFEDSEKLGRDSSGKNHHGFAKIRKPAVMSPVERARLALVHTLLNSNELVYVD